MENTAMIAIGILLWIAIGLKGFIYWWTTEYDLEISSLLLGLITSIIGPGTWILGRIIHSSSTHKPRVLIKKKENYRND